MKKIYTIGRDESCDIVIPDTTDIISRLHATIRIESNGKIFLMDQSRNGTYVNGMKMSSNVEIPVSRKDVVSFAHIYNLDWTLVPKHGGNLLKNVLITLLGLVMVTGITYVIISYLNKPESVDTPTGTSEYQGLPPVQDNTVKPDTIVVRDTIVVSKEKPKVEEVEKDSVKVENPEEEVYNPIY